MSSASRRTTLGRRQFLLAGACAVFASGLGGCKRSEAGGDDAAAQPLPIGDGACGTCGMIVAQQPAPRAQLVHRDGTRVHLCSMSDLAIYTASPSAHGRPAVIFVEALEPGADPAEASLAPRPWVPVRSAGFVVGIDRAGIMGKPALAYATQGEAEAMARQYGGVAVTWEDLRRHLL
jgi:copper chaperone NosL